MKIPPTIVILLAVLLSVASAVVVALLKYDDFFREEAEIPAEFTSLEFDADDTSYSPAETHSMNQLSKELLALKEKLLERERNWTPENQPLPWILKLWKSKRRSSRESKTTLLPDLRISRLRQGQDISEAKLKEHKETAKRWVEMGLEVASIEIQNWRQKKKIRGSFYTFEQLKAEDKALIIAFMLNSDQDVALIELVDALAMRDRTASQLLDLDEAVPFRIPN